METGSKTERIRKVVIVGGGSAGWMTAAALSRFLDRQNTSITLIESEEIGTVGVGEATLPHLRAFNEKLGIPENDFMAKTNATYKMGIEFQNFGALGDAYIHPFGAYGQDVDGIGFHHYFKKLRDSGDTTSLDEYSLPIMAALAGKFTHPSPDPRSVLSTFGYAYHLDAKLYAAYLHGFSEKNGVKRIEGKVVQVNQNPDTGFITSVDMDDGSTVDGELFIDCSGFRGLLINGALGSDYEDWLDYLPCDSAVAVPCKLKNAPPPYTRAIAREAGWTWHIPLQHRMGNGYVYGSDFISADEATAKIMDNLEGDAIAEPLHFKFKAGRRKEIWIKNCVAIGLANGFLEPIESTALYLVQSSITKLIEHFPDTNFCEHGIKEFNALLSEEYEWIRDFVILHYKATSRTDTPFWQRCKDLKVPDSLQHKMDLYRSRGYIIADPEQLFLKPSWLAVYNGQGIHPNGYDPRVDALPFDRIKQMMTNMKGMIAKAAASMPSHSETIAQNCPAEDSVL